jgi:mRNA interferase MazF
VLTGTLRVMDGDVRAEVVNVTALVTVDKSDLGTATGQLPPALMNDVDRGLRRVLGL